MPTGFEQDQYRAQVELVRAVNRLAKAIERINDIGMAFANIPHIALSNEQLKQFEQVFRDKETKK